MNKEYFDPLLYCSGIIDTRQVVAPMESNLTDARQGLRNFDARQATAISKCIIADARHALGNFDARQADALIEDKSSDACKLDVLSEFNAR